VSVTYITLTNNFKLAQGGRSQVVFVSI